MKHLKLFSTDADYQSFVSNVKAPNVSFVEGDVKIYYNPSVEEKPIEIVLPEIDTTGFDPILRIINRETNETYPNHGFASVLHELESYFYNLFPDDSYYGFIITYPNYQLTHSNFNISSIRGKIYTTPTIILFKQNNEDWSMEIAAEIDISNYSVYNDYLSKIVIDGYSLWYDVTWDKSPIRQIECGCTIITSIYETVINDPNTLTLYYMDEDGLVEWD